MEVNQEKQFSAKAKHDFKLIRAAVENNDEKAYAELMQIYKKPVYHVVLKMVRNTDDADDLTIEAFAKAFKNLHKFNPEFAFSTWLFRIATNNCIDFIRKNKIKTMSIDSAIKIDNGDEITIDFRDQNLNPQETTIKNQKIEIMQHVVSRLPDKYQRLVTLRYFDELSYEEIATELKAPLGTVKAQLHRARELLYDMVKGKKEII
ncbi:MULTISPECIES: RNA polymerase sigma factor [Hymenobacter]|uniref:RNA polymerase sigma-70 factor, ECF subfamily n=4 Tax=Hymenobacter TaxID=89966 RepID=A0A1I0ACK2_9BACT|nr:MULTISPECIES: sigma-70 family RNA polymerase sigma factor [Hymenobacter]MBT2559439.1 sigma-70 family RNA polymerase sigma factor [Hymenobacter sp. ISL-91]NVO30829.1 sigma-70 family RNA polymerase sigma factor [Hymenobacter lapidiphilus]NVO84689.1 sigma-70 family RNA polymerase sigma factor [Hymenobacter terrestris]RFP64018.1 sigma-70 family RNA polymerase sigma factor [Hymenobacter sp. CCM 8763]SDX88713.1 RNA polymerase sigma-70 factor, ECF subfamily [Hymenobacter psychrophilus]